MRSRFAGCFDLFISPAFEARFKVNIYLASAGGEMTLEQPRRRRFLLCLCRSYWVGDDSSGEFLNTIYKPDPLNHLQVQLFTIEPMPMFLGTLGQLEDHRQGGGPATAS